MLHILLRVSPGRLFGNIIKTYIVVTGLLITCYLLVDQRISRANHLSASSRHETNVNVKLYYKGDAEHAWHEVADVGERRWQGDAEDGRSHVDAGNERSRRDAETDADVRSADEEDGGIQRMPEEFVDEDLDPAEAVLQNKHLDTPHTNNNKDHNHVLMKKWEEMAERQNNLYKHAVIHRIRGLSVFYLTAVAGNSTPEHTYDRLVLNGWETSTHLNNSYFCCLANDNGRQATPVTEKVHWNLVGINIIVATQFVCQIPSELLVEPGSRPVSAGLSINRNCGSSKMINITYAEKKAPGSIAVCAKVVFGEYPANRIIEWFEIHKEMKVNHFHMFTYNVTEATRSVLHHYEKQGILTTHEFDFPMKLAFPRHLGQKSVVAWHDEQVPVYDCLERFYGYNYVAVLDIDEFLVSKMQRYNNWSQMFNKFMQMLPKAAGFTFHTEIFTLTWGVSNPNGGYFVTRYINRTRSMWDRRKNILIPARVKRGTTWTHGYEPKAGYRRVNVSSTDATIMHYRSCRSHWRKQGTCKSGRHRYTDRTMAQLMPRVANRVDNVKDIFIPPSEQLL